MTPTAQTCAGCHKPTTRCREQAYACQDCGKVYCGLCVIEQWDGEPGFHCSPCKREAARIERGDWTPAELEAAGQLRLLE